MADTPTMNPDRDANILRLWAEGYTSGQIGTALGLPRNAVVGVVFRARARGVDVDPSGFHRKLNGGRNKDPSATYKPAGYVPQVPRTPEEALMAKVPARLKHDGPGSGKGKRKSPTVAAAVDFGGVPSGKVRVSQGPVVKGAVPIYKLKTDGCKYPVSHTPKGVLLFCNKHRDRESYCDEHHALCHVKVQPKPIRRELPSWLR